MATDHTASTPAIDTAQAPPDRAGDPADPKAGLRLAAWTLVYVIALAGFARAIRFDLATSGKVAAGLFVVGLTIRLTYARRSSPLTSVRWLSWGGLAAGLFFFVSSAVTQRWESWGFAGLGLAMYSIVAIVDYKRALISKRDDAARTRMAVRWSAVGAASVVAGWMVGTVAGGWWAVGIAAVVLVYGVISVEVNSAAYPSKLSDHPWQVAIVGAGVLIVACAIVLRNTDLDTALWVVLGLGVVAALLTTGNDTPALVGVLLIAAFWSGVPRTAADQPGRSPITAEPYFAVLGDSYISGEGAESYFEGTNTTNDESNEHGNQCRRAPTAWPMLLNPPDERTVGATMGVPAGVAFWACSGAVTPDIRRTAAGDRRDEPEQLDKLAQQMADLGGAPPLFVVVSVGGNDLQFGDVGASCIMPGNCKGFIDDVREARLTSVGDELARTYLEIRGVVGAEVPVIAVPYPIPAHEGESCRGVLLSRKDVTAINGFAAALNGAVKDAATAAGVMFMDTIPMSLENSGAQLCDPYGEPGLNFADLNPVAGGLWSALNVLNWKHNFIHPNEHGHRILAAAALDWFEANPCVLAGGCAEREVKFTTPSGAVADLRDLSNLGQHLPDETESSISEPLGEAAPTLLAGASVLVLGWWLLLTALLGWKVDAGIAASSIGRRLEIARRLLKAATNDTTTLAVVSQSPPSVVASEPSPPNDEPDSTPT